MFGLCCGKRSAKVEDVNGQTRSSEKSVSVPATPSEKLRWLHRFFGRPTKKSTQPKKEEKKRVATSEDIPTEAKKKAKRRWWRRNNKVAPSPTKEESPKEEKRQDKKIRKVKVQIVQKKNGAKAVSIKTHSPGRRNKFRGFPNPAQFCYMNSCLQSLLTLEDFVRGFSSQEKVWSSDPEAALIRIFMEIRKAHLSSDVNRKINLLFAFKEVVSVWAPEFQDLDQKDAHEFLTSILDQMRTLGPQLQAIAASQDRSYSCPVENFLVFRIQRTRTCKRCGAASISVEEYTNLSLDLIPRGGSVEDMLHHYLTETELEYNCECGGTTSRQHLSFVDLPKVLVLHLKRFRFTPSYRLQKVCDPVDLFRDLVVSSNQGGGCFSLVSTISHISYTAGCGHYICDGVDVSVPQEDPTDRWLTYNDAEVTETTGKAVCNQRKNVSYVLFYKRHD